MFRVTLEQNIHTTVESDLPATHPPLTGTSIARIKMLLATIAASGSLTPDLVTLKRLLDITDNRTLKSYLGYRDDAGVIMAFGRTARPLKAMEKPRKIYLGDVNEAHALQPTGRADTGSVRETFFAQSVSVVHALRIPDKGAFATDSGMVFEVGGRSKTARQIQEQPDAYLAIDGIETGVGARIPLWAFGFLYRPRKPPPR